MQIANLGDSGFMVFRDAKCLFSSEVSLPLLPKRCYMAGPNVPHHSAFAALVAQHAKTPAVAG